MNGFIECIRSKNNIVSYFSCYKCPWHHKGNAHRVKTEEYLIFVGLGYSAANANTHGPVPSPFLLHAKFCLVQLSA